MDWHAYLSDMAPFFALAVVAVSLVVVVNRHGHKLTRHQDWMRVLELRIANLHKDRAAQHVRSLQVVKGKPPDGTIEVQESWLLGDTQPDTKRYPVPKKKGRDE